MTLPARTIDLGELPPRGEQPEIDAPWPVLARLRRRPDRRRAVRFAGAAVATTLALLSLAAAAGPARPVFMPLVTVQAIGFSYDQEHLYVIEPPGTTTGAATLAAYRLDDGTVRWTVPVPAGDGAWPVLREGTLLVVSEQAGTRVSSAFDPDSGRPLWQRDQGFLDTVARGLLLFSEPELPFAGEASEPPTHQLTAVDPATGQPVWTMPVTGWSHSYGGPDSTHFAVLDREERLTSYDLATGEPVATTRAPRAEYSEVQAIGSLAVVLDRSGLPPILTGYDLATLAPLWTATDLDRQDVTLWLASCGELVCLAGERPRAIDPDTGQTVWSADWLPADDRRDRWFMISDPGHPRLDGTFLLSDVTPAPGETASWLGEAGTGEPVLDLEGWSLGLGGWSPGLGRPAPPPDTTTTPPLLVRPAAGAVLVGQLRPDLSGVQVLGAIQGATPPPECQALTRHVLCTTWPVTGNGPVELTIWQHRS